jgi:hypothetical protein
MPSSTCFNLRKATLLLALVLVTIISCSQSLLQVCSYYPPRLSNIDLYKNRIARVSHCETSLGMASTDYDQSKASSRIEGDPHVENVLFVECGFGNDSHGES